jgi:hypothetical protein
LNIRLSDSITIELPVAVYRGDNLTLNQQKENKRAVEKAWRAHFNNVRSYAVEQIFDKTEE